MTNVNAGGTRVAFAIPTVYSARLYLSWAKVFFWRRSVQTVYI